MRASPFRRALLVLLFLGGLLCRPLIPAQGNQGREDPGPPSVPPAETDPREEPRIAVLPGNPKPGEPFTLGALGLPARDGELKALLLDEDGKPLNRASLFPLEDPGDPSASTLMAAVLAVPSTAKTGLGLVRVLDGEKALLEIPLIIDKRDFASEVIDLNQGNTDIRTRPDPRKIRESEELRAILAHTGREIFSSGPFHAPVASTRRTSFFGDRRIYRYVNGSRDTAIHAGVDYGVPLGTEVRACARGRVVMARERIVTGNSVILEHLPGVYSLYYHLDSLAVSEGDLVETGAPLGNSGSTGLSTGPHLHWEIRAAGENADPDAFVERAVLDKEAILGKLVTR